MQYNINTKATSKVYEVVIHGSVIGGISIVLPEPLFIVDNYFIFLNARRDHVKIYDIETKKESSASIHIHEHYGIGVYDDVVYLTLESYFGLAKFDLNKLDSTGYVRYEYLESVQSSDGYLIVDDNILFLLNLNKMKGLFMFDLLTDDVYLLENISVQTDDKLYISDKQMVILDKYDTSSRTLSLTLGVIE